MPLDKMNLVKPLINSQKTKFMHIIHAVTKSIRSDMLAQVFVFLQLCTIYSGVEATTQLPRLSNLKKIGSYPMFMLKEKYDIVVLSEIQNIV